MSRESRMAPRLKVESCFYPLRFDNKNMDTKDVIAENITGLRKMAGMTQMDLANRLDYSDKAISKWERAQSLPDAEMLQKIALLFHVDINYLFVPHAYSPLSQEEDRKLQKREFWVKTIYISSFVLFFVTLSAALLSALADYYGKLSPIKAYLFIMPCVPFILWIINLVFHGKETLNTVYLSSTIWALSLALYFYLEGRFTLIFAIAAVLQIALLLFPYISKNNSTSAKKNQAK